uniref:Uncharacterized protein n=1 Tax=Cannabis sativa TaxID=3483 RepID=A0A803QRX8_CANSA
MSPDSSLGGDQVQIKSNWGLRSYLSQGPCPEVWITSRLSPLWVWRWVGQSEGVRSLSGFEVRSESPNQDRPLSFSSLGSDPDPNLGSQSGSIRSLGVLKLSPKFKIQC